VNERGVKKQTLFEGCFLRLEFVCFSRKNEHSGNFSEALIFSLVLSLSSRKKKEHFPQPVPKIGSRGAEQKRKKVWFTIKYEAKPISFASRQNKEHHICSVLI